MVFISADGQLRSMQPIRSGQLRRGGGCPRGRAAPQSAACPPHRAQLRAKCIFTVVAHTVFPPQDCEMQCALFFSGPDSFPVRRRDALPCLAASRHIARHITSVSATLCAPASP